VRRRKGGSVRNEEEQTLAGRRPKTKRRSSLGELHKRGKAKKVSHFEPRLSDKKGPFSPGNADDGCASRSLRKAEGSKVKNLGVPVKGRSLGNHEQRGKGNSAALNTERKKDRADVQADSRDVGRLSKGKGDANSKARTKGGVEAHRLKKKGRKFHEKTRELRAYSSAVPRKGKLEQEGRPRSKKL